MAPPQDNSILYQMELHQFRPLTYGFLAGAFLAKDCRPDFNNGLGGDSNSDTIMVSWWVLYLAKGSRPDFNDGLGGDSNSGQIWPPGLSLT